MIELGTLHRALVELHFLEVSAEMFEYEKILNHKFVELFIRFVIFTNQNDF